MVQPQNRFTFLWPLQIGDVTMVGAILLHVLSAMQDHRPLIRFGPATVLSIVLLAAGFLAQYFGALQTYTGWNGYIDMLVKNSVLLIMVEATATNIERVWAVQITMLLATLWWVKGGLRLSASGATYAGDRLMGAAVSLIENPNGFAYMMCIFLPLYLYCHQQMKQKSLRLAFLGLALCCVYIIFETGSRTGLMALIAFGVFAFPKYGRHNIRALLAIALATTFILSLVGKLNIERFKSIPQSISSFLRGEELPPEMMSQDEQSAVERRLKNRDTWALIKEHPLFGVGMNPDPAKYMDKYPYAVGQVHNELLMAGREMGFIGMGLYLGLLASLYLKGRQIQKNARSWPAVSDLGWTFKMQAVVIFIGGMFSPLPWNPPMMVLVGSASALSMLVAGMAVSPAMADALAGQKVAA